MKSALVYAYIGDSVYETYVRKYLVNQNISKVKDLQHASLSYVSANSQSKILEDLENNNILNEKELEIIKWGRNAKGGKARHANIITYRHATSLECLIGYLYLENNIERLDEIMSFILK
ncbi:MAG: Mini-ribonuclease 3 [Bacilli bacterium]|nr:Mini-ribonuclease 3 [Bacilli bacterium]